MERVLFVLSSHGELGNSPKKTGVHLAEITHAYEVLRSAGLEIDFVSPRGGPVPLEHVDLEDSINEKWMNNEVFRAKIENTLVPEQVRPDQYGAVYYPGGHGAMFDLPRNEKIAAITAKIYDRGGIVAAVCHGSAGLLSVHLGGGESLVRGKEIAGFTNEEEVVAGRLEQLPFLLEDRLIEEGALHVKKSPFEKHVVVSDRLITGQNPASARAVAEEIRKRLTGGQAAFVDRDSTTIAP